MRTKEIFLRKKLAVISNTAAQASDAAAQALAMFTAANVMAEETISKMVNIEINQQELRNDHDILKKDFEEFEATTQARKKADTKSSNEDKLISLRIQLKSAKAARAEARSNIKASERKYEDSDKIVQEIIVLMRKLETETNTESTPPPDDENMFSAYNGMIISACSSPPPKNRVASAKKSLPSPLKFASPPANESDLSLLVANQAFNESPL